MKGREDFVVHPLEKVLQINQVPESAPSLPSQGVSLSRLLTLMGLAIALTASIYGIRQYLRQPLTSLSVSEQSSILATTEFAGKVQPATHFKIASLSSAIVKEVYVQVGDRVVAGQPLLVIENLDAKREYEQLKQQQEVAQQQLSQLQAQLNSLTQVASLSDQMSQAEERFSIAQLQSQQVPLHQRQDSVQRVQASYDLALLQYNRMKTLAEAGATSQADLDKATTELRIAKADLVSAQTATDADQTLELEQRNRLAVQQQMTRAQQQQQIVQLRGQFEVAQFQYNQTTQKLDLLRNQAGLSVQTGEIDFQLIVSATKDGVVAAVPASVGDQTYTGTALVELSQIDRLNVEIPVSAQLVNSLRVGQLAEVQVGAGAKAPRFEGTVVSISPLPSEDLHHLVKVQFINPDHALLIEQSAKVRFR
jgi:multidrug efflux pump subunit AcrA (membrane-fusion protein)